MVQERNAVVKDPRGKIRVALVYPNLYRAGMANLGFQTIYDLLNSREDVACERFFLDFDRSLETGSPLKDFHIIAFSWQFELDALNILKLLDRSGLPLRRGKREQLVVAGGPCTVNPYPMRGFIDVFFIGEAEANIHEFIDAYAAGEGAPAFEDIPGIYVSEEDNPVRRVFLEDLDSYHPVHQIMSPAAAYGRSFLLEVSRGCGRGCRFCLGGFITRPPRERSLGFLEEVVDRGVRACEPDKFSLIGASVSDYSGIEELCGFLSEKGREISMPSLRADTLSEVVVDTIVGSGQRSLTLAPEANQRLRDMVGKGITDEEIESSARLAFARGVRTLKLYYILGLPGETDDDVLETAGFVKRLKKSVRGKIRLSINPFVPKAHTPLQWAGLVDQKTYKRRLRLLKKEAGVELESEDYKSAFLQATIARGDQDLGAILEKVCGYGGGMGAFRRAFKEAGVELGRYAAGRGLDEPLPWAKVDTWVKEGFLRREFEKYFRGEASPVCKEACKKCGVC
ncbi:MAG: radical SAM protein [Euryarchaeota archaeon]|nr:radical SAM protein [Euryarchaeota archaeon]